MVDHHNVATSAQRAAAALPGNRQKPMGWSDRFLVGVVLLAFALLPIWVFSFALSHTLGWLWLLAGLPTWLILRWQYFRLQGAESGLIIADAAGTVRVITGHAAVRRMCRLFETGAKTWLRRSRPIGLAIGILAPVAWATLAVSLNTPEIMVLFLTTLAFAAWDLLRFVIMQWRFGGQPGARVLDATVMLPLLALYARQRGGDAVAAPVPADSLLETVMANPVEREIARNYVALSKWLSKVRY